MFSQTKIICIGNCFRGDDGVGLIIAEQLRNLHLKNISIVESDGEGLNLINEWEGGEKVIIVDAIKTNSKPGTIHIINPLDENIQNEKSLSTTHFFNLAQAINISKNLNKIPKEITFIGIEGKSYNLEENLSAAVKDSIDQIIKIILNMLNK